MTQGPYGGAFAGDPYVPGASRTFPQVQTIDATTVTPFAATLTGAALGARLLRRLYIRGPAGSYARLHVGDPTDQRAVRDVTYAGDEDVAEYAPEIFIPQGQSVSVVWNTSPGTGLCFATYEWIDL